MWALCCVGSSSPCSIYGTESQVGVAVYAHYVWVLAAGHCVWVFAAWLLSRRNIALHMYAVGHTVYLLHGAGCLIYLLRELSTCSIY